ncbi:Dual-specificity RNA pseudouridine synthase RluA [Sinobacterium norvegicum]|uniref:Dual-specificity RNA pseudouridine synthase RluA n=1 Tax=Sinobacterium norvegicum TaxID=1641715 RepID=A0ABN8EJ61_9GAMM|nr:RluA family pseudouridine synthase [Sinobacterium norvegicum]CAH0991780.1 Dual-specificity RNA pseudouridine synthase RluA [Sinobacterium norvegicum]
MATDADDFVAPPCFEQIDILYQDDDLLLINKPSGLLSLSGKNPLNKDSVHHRLVQDYPSALMLHRLDLGTSGIMIIALNKATNKAITLQFQQRTIEKSYNAILRGQLKHSGGTIDAPIARGDFPRQVISPDGKAAQSHYEVLEQKSDRCRVLFTPLTGRTHQLRIHSQHIGHPILGCDLYGDEQSLAMADRLMLHATTIDFNHPVSGKRIHGVSPCPF